MKKILIFSALALMTNFCTPEKSPIEYGLDKCFYCKMTIVDKRFGAEMVTRKGKVFKFDATECLINYLHQVNQDDSETAFLLTNTLDKPGELVPVTGCYFLQSENLPSPMGEYINPFSEKATAYQQQDLHDGRLYLWEDLKTRLRENIGSR